jgi:two-component system LytT family sensor kinase
VTSGYLIFEIMHLTCIKEERIKYLGFDDHWMIALGIFPLALLADVLFVGGHAGVNMGWEFGLACYALSLFFCGIYWFASRFITIYFRHVFPKRISTRKRILLTISAIALFVVFLTLVTNSFVTAFRLEASGAESPGVLFKMAMSFVLNLMVYSGYEGAYYFTKYKESLLEQERLAKENMQAQLSVLKQQVNPHFLFNSLNTLVNVIPEDAQRATLFTQRLAAVYRRILEYRHRELISLDEELQALGDYVFLMQTRFEEKLRIEWEYEGEARRLVPGESLSAVDLPPYLRDYQIVPLAAQLLVENAIKHNVISQDHPLTVKINLREDCLTIENNLHLRERQLNSTGWGHHNIRRRYQLVTDQKVEIFQDDQIYRVSIPLLRPEIETRYATA